MEDEADATTDGGGEGTPEGSEGSGDGEAEENYAGADFEIVSRDDATPIGPPPLLF